MSNHLMNYYVWSKPFSFSLILLLDGRNVTGRNTGQIFWDGNFCSRRLLIQLSWIFLSREKHTELRSFDDWPGISRRVTQISRFSHSRKTGRSHRSDHLLLSWLPFRCQVRDGRRATNRKLILVTGKCFRIRRTGRRDENSMEEKNQDLRIIDLRFGMKD